MTPDDIDPSSVIAYVILLAAFAAGLELSQMTAHRRFDSSYPRKEPRWKIIVYWLIVAGIVIGGGLIVHWLSSVFP